MFSLFWTLDNTPVDRYPSNYKILVYHVPIFIPTLVSLRSTVSENILFVSSNFQHPKTLPRFDPRINDKITIIDNIY